ncbi:MAG: hypothetical protein ACK2U1_21240 [Anaerolineales bacterium]|jgi:hypothetical protein
MNFIRMLLFSSVFATALLMGYKAGETIDPLNEVFSNRIDTTIMPSVAIPDNDQFNLLIIGVDDLSHVDAQLESIWLAAYAENSNHITLIPVFPSSDDPDQNMILSDSFSIEQGKPREEFWDEMRKENFWWKGYVISDKDSTIRIIDLLGGIDMQNQQMDGLQAVRSITSWNDDTQLSIKQQRILFESVCNKIFTDQIASPQMINDFVNQNSLADTRTKTFITNLIANIKYNGSIACNFPTLTKTSSHTETGPE